MVVDYFLGDLVVWRGGGLVVGVAVGYFLVI